MTKEDYVRRLIAISGRTIKDFAKLINLPYSTLLSILNRGLDSASITNVMNICAALGITVEELLNAQGTRRNERGITLTPHEEQLVLQYRANEHLQLAVDAILGI